MSRPVTLVSVVVLALAVLVGRGLLPDAAAQDGAASASYHPLVGAWWWENIADDPFDDSYAVFGADGTYVEETTYIGAGIGSWDASGERMAELIIVFQDTEGGLDPNQPEAFVPGTVTLWLTLEVDASGDTLTATGPVEIRTQDGALVDAFTFDGTATRLSVGRAKPAATPTT